MRFSSLVIVDGNWGAWGAYSSCSKTCGTGIKTRSRECDDPAPVGLGEDCSGDTTETALCNTESCTGRVEIVVLSWYEK